MWGPIPGWNTGKAIEHIWDQSEGNIFYLSQNFRETGCWAADRALPREGEGTAVRALSPPGSKAGQCHREASLQAPRESSLKARRGTPATAGGWFWGAVRKRRRRGRSRRDRLTGCAGKAAARASRRGAPPPAGTSEHVRLAGQRLPAGTRAGCSGRVLGRPQRRPQPRHSHVVSGGNSAALSAPMAKAL